MTQAAVVDVPVTRVQKKPEPGAFGRQVFGDRGAHVARALAEAVIPGGRMLAPAGDAAVDRLARLLGSFGEGTPARYAKLLASLEQLARLRTGRRFTALSPERRAELVWSLHEGDLLRRAAFMALTYPLKNAYFDDLDVYHSFGCVWQSPQAQPEKQRWMQQVTSAAELDETLECDVVVVGTGAGGAVVAKELAERGVAVLLLEEGEYNQRQDFDRRTIPATRKLYRDGGLTGVVGNCVIPIPQGRTVGGSTTINAGTCLRTPPWILERWQSDLGLEALSPDGMKPYYDKVERTLEIGANGAKERGKPAEVLGRGCDTLGWSHFPVPRNAPECDGQGVCQWGCPTDAKRSTNVSYVPMALSRGAQLVTGFKVDEVIVENGRAVGVRGRCVSGGRRLEVRARGVILACGALQTPVLLMRQGLATANGQVGKNLTIHPATSVSAIFDEEIRGFEHVPQGHGIDQFHRDGILILGASAPLDMGATMFPFVGQRYVDVMENYDRIASFGVMVEDEPSGRIVLGPKGRPLALYKLGRRERKLLARGSAAIARVFFAAGAKAAYTEIHGFDELTTTADVDRLENACPGGLDVTMVAFHPLGTCRMGTDPETSVVDPSFESHEVPGLYIVDGSVVPTSIAVNPQLTIMALATRAGEVLAQRFT